VAAIVPETVPVIAVAIGLVTAVEIAEEIAPVTEVAIEGVRGPARVAIAPEPRAPVRAIAPKAAAPSRRATAPAQVPATGQLLVEETGPAEVAA
jgi:hypothetical protein